MKTHMLLRTNEGGQWKTVTGAIADGWATYDNVDDCLTWQNRLSDRKLLNHDVAQVICVPEDKLAAFTEAEAKGASTQQLVATSPANGFDLWPEGAMLLGIGAVILFGIGVLRAVANRRWL